MAVLPAPVRFLANGNFPRASRQSLRSANDKGDNGMMTGAVHSFPDIYLTAEEISARRPSMKAVRLNGVSSFQMRSVRPHRTSGKEKERKSERTKGFAGITSFGLLYVISSLPAISGKYSPIQHMGRRLVKN